MRAPGTGANALSSRGFLAMVKVPPVHKIRTRFLRFVPSLGDKSSSPTIWFQRGPAGWLIAVWQTVSRLSESDSLVLVVTPGVDEAGDESWDTLLLPLGSTIPLMLSAIGGEVAGIGGSSSLLLLSKMKDAFPCFFLDIPRIELENKHPPEFWLGAKWRDAVFILGDMIKPRTFTTATSITSHASCISLHTNIMKIRYCWYLILSY